MKLQSGDQAHDHDAWFRVVSNDDHFNKQTNHVHHAFFKGNGITKPQGEKPWKSECSGRLRSLADDIIEDGERRAERMKQAQIRNGSTGKKAKFIGIISNDVAKIKRFQEAKTDVIFEPIDKGEFKDKAHANWVFHDKLPEEVKTLEFINEMIKIFEFIEVMRIPVWGTE